MRVALASIVLLCACNARIVRGIALPVAVNVHVHANVHEAPPQAVALEGAPVVEFFGVPLDNAQDVVFVLDCSGSMSEPAGGRIAELHTTPPPPPDLNAPPPTAAPM